MLHHAMSIFVTSLQHVEGHKSKGTNLDSFLPRKENLFMSFLQHVSLCESFTKPSLFTYSARFSTLNTLSLYLRTREVETTYSIIPRANLESSRAAAHVALPEHARDTQ